jgi:hypothetical protein
MTTLIPALGGERLVPAPDPIARDYLLLALRLDQRSPGLVDGYFGPADLKAQVDMEQLRAPARLADDAAALRARLPDEVADDARRRWLDAQLVALEAQARALAGDALPYLDHVERCFDFRPTRRPDSDFAMLRNRLEALVPGAGPLPERLAALDATLTIPPDRVAEVADLVVARFRERARAQFGLPEGESLRIELVHDQPWSGYNWYDGGLRSRVSLNLDLPIRAPDAIHVLAHETYPGHHLEHAWKEADLVGAQRRLESSVLLINTPECLISEGLADLGHDFATDPAGEAELVAEIAQRVGLTATVGSSASIVELAAVRRALGAVAVNAALMRHVEGASHDEAASYLVEVGLMSPERAEQRLQFIEHPLWRTYVFVYSEGEALLRRWLDGSSGNRAARFARLLHEQITPGEVVAEVGQPGESERTNSDRSSPSPS